MLVRSVSIAALSPKPLMTTSAPSFARARAIARPMPLVEPVTRAWRLARDIGNLLVWPSLPVRVGWAYCNAMRLYIALRRRFRGLFLRYVRRRLFGQRTAG